jgi:DNA polymerase-3 subunit alpha
MEKEMVGVYLSGHPLSEYEKELEKHVTINSSDIAELSEEAEVGGMLQDGSRAVVGGIIIKKQNKITKGNNMMAFVTIEDLFGTVEVIIFPKIYEKYKDLIYEDNIIVAEGTLNVAEEETPKLICNKITELTAASGTSTIITANIDYNRNNGNNIEKKAKKLYIKVRDQNYYKSIKGKLFESISKCSGNEAVIIYSESEKTNMVLPQKNCVNCSDTDLISNLKSIFGEKNIAVK